jgi:hypothetical protein
MTLDEIAERLALPKTTVWYWIKDLPLGPRTNPGQRKGNEAMQAKYRRLREEAYARGAAEYNVLMTVPTFRDFVVLYIAEGYKRNRNQVSLANSDPTVITVAANWIRRFTRNALAYSVQYHADQDLAELREFWGGLLDIAGSAVRLQRKSNSNQLKARTWRSPHGVLTISVGDTMLRSRLQAWMDLIRLDWV